MGIIMNSLVVSVLSLTIIFILSCTSDNAEKNARKEIGETTAQVVWNIDNLTSIGGNTTTVLGSPGVIDTPSGKAVEFVILGPDEAKGYEAGVFVPTCPRCLARVEACMCTDK